MRAIWRCCGVAEKQSVDNQGWSLALAPALDCSYPARSLGNPSAAITSEEGSTRTGRVALCKPGGPLAHRQLAPGKLPHQWVLQRVLFGSAFHSSQLPNSEGEQRTTLREHSINRNPGLVRQLSLHNVMELEMENIRDAMGAHQKIKHHNHQLQLDTMYTPSTLGSGAPTTEPTVDSQCRDTEGWNSG